MRDVFVHVCVCTSVGGVSGSLAIREQSCHPAPSFLATQTHGLGTHQLAHNRQAMTNQLSHIYLRANQKKMSAR